MTFIEITKEMELMAKALKAKDLESYNNVLNYFLSKLGDIHQGNYQNMTENASELSSRLKYTEDIDKTLLNKTRLKLSLAIPLLKAKGKDDLVEKLELNLKDILDWLNHHVELSEYSPNMDHQPPLNDEEADPLGLLIRSNNFSPEIKDLAKRIVADSHKRPIDRVTPEIMGKVAKTVKGYQDSVESAPDQFMVENELILRSVQKMMEEREQSKLADERAIGFSKTKAREELESRNHLSKNLRLAADLFLKSIEGGY